MLSLNARLLIAASLVLAVFLGLTGWVLDRAFRDSAQAALEDRLQGQMYALIAASELRDDGSMFIPDVLPEARLSTLGSGLYAQVVSHDLKQRWRSPSSVGLSIPFEAGLARGTSRYAYVNTSSGVSLYTFNFGLAWEIDELKYEFTFSVGEDLESFKNQVAQFRNSLWRWLVGVAVILLAMQGTILRWGLLPLRRVADDLTAIERGQATHLTGVYPKELNRLTTNLNTFISSEREHLARYRNSLSDLAHSLKTPLAVLQGEVESGTGTADEQRNVLGEQIERMRQIVDYQLQKAATSGRTTLTAPIAVQPVIERLVRSVEKVYADKKVVCRIDAPPGVLFAGDKGDLMELAGNIIENAFKYCLGQVFITVETQTDDKRRQVLRLLVEDDGPGVAQEQMRLVQQRGVRVDEQTPGQGIGLAVARDIVRVYDGALDISRSQRLRGALVRITIPLK